MNQPQPAQNGRTTIVLRGQPLHPAIADAIDQSTAGCTVPAHRVAQPEIHRRIHSLLQASFKNSSRFGTIFPSHNQFEAVWVYSPSRLALTEINCTDGPHRLSACRKQIY